MVSVELPPRFLGVNEWNCISCYLSNLIKGEPRCFLLIPCLPFINTHASYRIGSNTAGLENASGFDEANFSSSLDQGKHLASSLNRFSLYNIYCTPCLCT
jgi:hypothetical protein